MGRKHHYDRSEKEGRTSADLRGLERMRAPWFFDAEVQRRLRMGDSTRRAARRHRMRVASVYIVLAACLAAAYLQFGDRLLELVPQPEPPAVPSADTLTARPASDTSRVVPGPAPAAATTVRVSATATNPPQDSSRAPAAGTVEKDSARAASPARSDTGQQPPLTDTTLRIEPQRAVPRADTSLAQPDSLVRPTGTP